jgi:hypothetical protein
VGRRTAGGSRLFSIGVLWAHPWVSLMVSPVGP